MVSKRKAKANNPMVEGYDSEKPNTWIMYLDANELWTRNVATSSNWRISLA